MNNIQRGYNEYVCNVTPRPCDIHCQRHEDDQRAETMKFFSSVVCIIDRTIPILRDSVEPWANKRQTHIRIWHMYIYIFLYMYLLTKHQLRVYNI